MRVLVRERVDRDGLIHAHGAPSGHVGAGHAGVVLRAGEVPEPEARNGRPDGLELAVSDHQRFPPVLQLHVLADRLADDLPLAPILGAGERVDAALEVAASRSSFRQPSSRAASSVAVARSRPRPRSRARRCGAQSLNRQAAASVSMSANDRSRPASASHDASSRMPGVSRTTRRPAEVQLAAGRRVAAPRVVLADRLFAACAPHRRGLSERRLADARRADERHGQPGLDPRPDGADAAAVDR